MSECGQAYREYIVHVADPDKSHGAQTTREICIAPQYSDFSILQRKFEMMCPGLSTRDWPLHLVAKAHKYTRCNRKGESEQGNVQDNSFCFN